MIVDGAPREAVGGEWIEARPPAYSSLLDCGQGCTSTERVYIPRSRSPEFTEELVEHVRSLRLANDSPVGLGASLLSSDPQRVKRFVQGVRAGAIGVNDPLTDNYAGPFGDMWLSGGTRELGPEGLDEFRTTKHVHWDFSTEPKDFWYP
jgi:acyl-CoA reductase-like NAD-dependent aldehyde dehydrogenase